MSKLHNSLHANNSKNDKPEVKSKWHRAVKYAQSEQKGKKISMKNKLGY
jgi:hypothetical protein